MSDTVPTASPPAVKFLDRDHSILAFNRRVLDWARRPEGLGSKVVELMA